jgi:hypothetical protein
MDQVLLVLEVLISEGKTSRNHEIFPSANCGKSSRNSRKNNLSHIILSFGIGIKRVNIS